MTVKEKLENGTFRDYQDILKLDSNNSCPFIENYSQEILDLLNTLDDHKLLDFLTIVTLDKKANNLVLKLPGMVDLLIKSGLERYKSIIKYLDAEVCDAIIDSLLKKNTSYQEIGQAFSYFNKEYQKNKIINGNLDIELLYQIFNSTQFDIITVILNHYNIDLTHNINIKDFFEKAKLAYEQSNSYTNKGEEVNLNPKLVNKKVIDHMWGMYNIYDFRSIIYNMEFVLDCDDINEYIREKEDKILEEHFKKNLLDNRLQSNIIIDYHFQDNFHDVIINIKEMLRLIQSSDYTIPISRLNIYQKILQIDKMNVKEKMELHRLLKKQKISEHYYDDLKRGRTKVGELLKKEALSSQTLQKYHNQELTEKHGIEIYYLDGEEFYGLVKTGLHIPMQLPMGRSYSLIGNGCLDTFEDPGLGVLYLYDVDELNPEQIVQVFPNDAFTKFIPNDASSNYSQYVNKLLTPKQILELSHAFNEILLLERGKIDLETNKDIPLLKPIALIVYDKIDDFYINIAKREQLPILLINTKKYTYSHPTEDYEPADDKYYHGADNLALLERRR